LIVGLAGQLEARIGPAGRWIFLVGSWTAVASSLLGVWQAVPYIFADYWRLHRRPMASRSAIHQGDAHRHITGMVRTNSWPYRTYLLALATIPLWQVGHPFREVQKYYAVMGAVFIPLLALVLLILGGRSRWIGPSHRNPTWAVLLLGAAVLLFCTAGYFQVRSLWQ